MTSYLYVPVIKGKANDIKAVSRVSKLSRGVLKPLVELVPVPPDATVDDHLQSFVHNLAKYGTTNNLFVDFYGFLPNQSVKDGTAAVIAGFKALRAQGIVATPTFGFDRDDAIWAPLKKEISTFSQGFCFRVDIDDLDDMSEETWQDIIERSAELGLKPAQVDVLIDLRYIGETRIATLKNLVLDFLAYVPDKQQYRSIILAGSSALKHVASIPKDGVGDVTRNELRLWMELQADVFGITSLVYGDYGVVHPEFTMVGPNKNANAKIRYTTNGKIRIFRGHRLADAPKYQQYYELANTVRDSDVYQGAQFSIGDNYVYNCADLNVGTGNLGTWVFVDMNHHFEFTARQIRELAPQIDATFSSDAIAEVMEAV